MACPAEIVTLELFKCINYMRTTVDGILASSNPNVWNVFGGLSRAKKAVFDILGNGLRLSGNKTEHDMTMILAVELLHQYPCGDVTCDFEPSKDAFLSWIEHHLLAHSLLDCIVCAFLQQTEENSLWKLYKEYSFMKNDVLLKELLNCLEALRQSSVHVLSSLNSIHTNKALFMNEFTPWVSEKMLEEYKIDHRPPDELEPELFTQNNYYNNVDNLCSNCQTIPPQMRGTLYECKCTEKQKTQSVSLLHSFSRDVLLKSALSAAVSHDGYDPISGWYEDDITMKSDLDDTRSRLTLMREISRSESSLFRDTGHFTEVKENKSDNDALDYNNDDKSVVLTDDDEFSLHNFTLPRSSFTVQRKKGHQRSKSDQVGVSQINFVDGNNDKVLCEVTSSSLPKELSVQASEESQTYYYQNEDGQLFPRPYKGQSLISYLDSRSYDTGAQLDKENAHFSICEALITAIEQMRCQKMDSGNDTDDGSDEEIKSLKEKLRDRRWMRRMEKQKKDTMAFSDISDTGKSSSFKTSSTLSSSFGSSNPEEAHLIDHDGMGNISDSWENLSLASKIKSPQSSRKEESEKNEEKYEEVLDDYSAEAVAKCLLKKFDGHSIPAASELKWIVTEEDVPQELLPLPTAFPVNPDSHLQNDYKLSDGFRKMSLPFQSLLRGNLEWAPPRPQIIFSTHPFVKRKVMLQRQHFRCAGCGLKVTPSLSKRFRFCEYLGKYFCTSCHQNKLTYIPSKILSKWDFKKYPVSDFAKELLKKIYRDPLFNVQDISPNLYKNVRMLAMVKKLRLQLHHMKNFINTCRHAIVCRKEIEKLAMHLIEDPHSYSVDDLLQVKTGEMHTLLKSIVSNGVKHITEDCPLCSAKGFFCEFCRDMDDILYPFDLHKVYICDDCKTCYHRACFVQGKCAKCERIRARNTMIQEPLPDLDSPTGPDS